LLRTRRSPFRGRPPNLRTEGAPPSAVNSALDHEHFTAVHAHREKPMSEQRFRARPRAPKVRRREHWNAFPLISERLVRVAMKDGRHVVRPNCLPIRHPKFVRPPSHAMSVEPKMVQQDYRAARGAHVARQICD